MVTIADDYNRANAGNLGGSWTDQAIGTPWSIVSNTSRPAAAGANAGARHNTTLAVPHWARETLQLGTGDGFVAVAVRVDAAAITEYVGGFDRSGSVITTIIYKIVGGTVTNILHQAVSSIAGGTVTLYATGTTSTVLTLVINGVMIAQVTDSTSPLSTQTRVGKIGVGATTVPQGEDFAASDVATVPLAPLGLIATPGNASIALSWTAPFNGMSAITDYLIEYSTNGTSWTTFSDGTSTATTALITGLTNGTAYYARVSAINAIGTGPSVSAFPFTPRLTIDLIGVGQFDIDTVTGNVVDAAFPASYTPVANDISILAAQGLHNNGSSLAPTPPSGYSQVATRFHEIGAYDLQITADIDRFAGGESAAGLIVPAAYSTSSGGLSAYQAVFRNVHQITAEEATAVVSSGAAAASFTPTGIVVTHEDAAVISMVATADDNALGLLSGSEQGFTKIAGGGLGASDYDSTTGGDHSMGMAWRRGAIQALQTQAAAPTQLTSIDGVAGTAYNYRWTGAGVTVFVPGGGIRGTHTEFTGRLGAGHAIASATGASAFTDNTASNALFNPGGHDTGVASMALGATQGVAKGATVYPITSVNAAQAAAGDLTRCIPAAAVLAMLSHILSVAVPGHAVVGWSNVGHAVGELDINGVAITSQNIIDMTAAVTALINAGIPFVASAGNQASSTYIASHFPMNVQDVINVGNVRADTLNASTTSNFGSGVHIWAPGSGDTGWNSASAAGNSSFTGPTLTGGTSEAGYIVCGVIACLLQGHPSYTPSQLKSILMGNALATGATGAGSNTLLVNSLYMPEGAIGTSICPTWSETINGNDPWAAITMALKVSDGSAPPAAGVNLASFFFA